MQSVIDLHHAAQLQAWVLLGTNKCVLCHVTPDPQPPGGCGRPEAVFWLTCCSWVASHCTRMDNNTVTRVQAHAALRQSHMCSCHGRWPNPVSMWMQFRMNQVVWLVLLVPCLQTRIQNRGVSDCQCQTLLQRQGSKVA